MSDAIAMWCTDCGVRLRADEIKGWGCPKCGNTGIPCSPDKDVVVQVNWHELHILCCWAEFWASRTAANSDEDGAVGMPKTVHAIARRLEHQWPEFGALTLGGEIADLPEAMAERGIEIGIVESNVPKPSRITVLNEVEDLLVFLRDLCERAIKHADSGEHMQVRSTLTEMQAELVLQTDGEDC